MLRCSLLPLRSAPLTVHPDWLTAAAALLPRAIPLPPPVCFSLPLSHVTLRLEAIAAGLWPAEAEATSDDSRVVRCLRTVLTPATGDNASRVVAGVYEHLLARRGALLDDGVAGAGVVLGGSGGGDGSTRTTLRLRLLMSLAAHCRIVLEEELSSSLTGQVRAVRYDAVRQATCGWVDGHASVV